MRPNVRNKYKSLNRNELIRVAGAVGDTWDETRTSVSSVNRTIGTLYTQNIYGYEVGDINITAVGAGSQINFGSDVEFGNSTTAYGDTIKIDHYYNKTQNDNTGFLISLSSTWLAFNNVYECKPSSRTPICLNSNYAFDLDGSSDSYFGLYYYNDFSTISGTPTANIFGGVNFYTKSSELSSTYASAGQYNPYDTSVYAYMEGYGSAGYFTQNVNTNANITRPELCAAKAIFSQAINSGTGSCVGYFGYGYSQNDYDGGGSSTGTAIGVLGYANDSNANNAWCIGLYGMVHTALSLNDHRWGVYSGNGHMGVHNGSLFVCALTSGATLHHPSILVARNVPTKFNYTNEGCLYVSNTAEVKSLLHCQNLITSPSISANSISSGIINSNESNSGLTFSITGSPKMHIDRKGNLILDKTVYDDLRVSLINATLGPANNPGLDVLTGAVRAYAFSPTVEEELFFEIQIPHDYKIGSTLYPHLHWCPKDNNAGNVVWGFEYTLAAPYGTFGNTTTVNTIGTVSGQLKHQMSEFTSFTASDISTVIIGRLFRKATDLSDTYGSDAYGLSFDIHYERDSLGSNSITAK